VKTTAVVKHSIGIIIATAGICTCPGAIMAQDQPATNAPDTTAAQPPDVALDPEQLPPSDSWLNGWTGSAAVGRNGASGNTDRVSFRAVGDAKRTVEAHETTINLLFAYGREDSRESENRFEGNLRNDWLFKDSPWRVFALAKYEFDEFQDWDSRVSFFAGPAYEFIDNETTFLLGRVGVGASREFGGEENKWTPEGLIGADFEHKFSDRQKISASADFFPALDQFGPYRFNAKAAWEIVVDPSNGLTLRVGIEDRYDSTPGDGFKRNDIDYFILLAWTF
jgi:hypothetical protein